MADHSPDVFDSEEEGESNEENVEEEPEEEQEDISSSEEEGEVGDEESDYDPWDPTREKVEKDLEESHIYMIEVKQFLDMGKTQEYAAKAAFNDIQRLLWNHSVKRDKLHRKVLKTLERFMDEDDMDFKEAAESAVEKRRNLIDLKQQTIKWGITPYAIRGGYPFIRHQRGNTPIRHQTGDTLIRHQRGDNHVSAYAIRGITT